MTQPTAGESASSMRPRALALELTKGCNLRCGYCYYAERDDAYDARTRMTPEVARQSVDLLIAEGPVSEPVHLHFFGGEPLLAFSLLCETVLYGEARAAERGREITFEVTTNATRLDEDIVSFLNEHRVHVGVSFDGPPEIQDVARPAASGSSYDMAIPGIRRLLESRRGTELEARTHCSVVVTRRGFDLVAIAEHLEGLGFRKIILTPATDLEGHSNGFSEAELPALLAAYDELALAYERDAEAGHVAAPNWFPVLMGRLLSGERKQHFCQGGRDYLGVATDGELALCYRFFEDEEFAMGNVATGVERAVTERLLAAPLDERTTCSKCWARYFCGGGCHHDNVTANGDPSEPNPVGCEVFRHSMGLTLDGWARLSRKGLLERRKTPSTTTMTEEKETPAFDGAACPRSAAQVHVRVLERERVIYDPASHEVCVLNGTAALIFELCDGEHSVDDMLARLVDTFEAPAEVLRTDLQATLLDLRSKRLVA
jgi:uncharacterized protein